MESQTIFGCMSNILEHFTDENNHRGRKKLNFSETRLDEVKEDTDYVCSCLNITPMQVVLFAAIMQNSASCNCGLDEIAEYMGFTYIKMLTYNRDIDALWDKWLIRRSGENIRVPSCVVNQLSENRPYERPATSNLSTRMILNRMGELFYLCGDNEISEVHVRQELDEIMYENKETSIGRIVEKCFTDGKMFIIPKNERFLFYLLVHLYYNKDIDSCSWNKLRRFFSKQSNYEELQSDYENCKLYMQEQKMLEYAGGTEMVAKDVFHLNNNFKKELLRDVGGLKNSNDLVGEINPESISMKKLFYNEHEETQISTLKRLLSEDQMARVHDSMKKNGLRTGFTCLFYGAPGTGKTETVYQLAKDTGRSIIVADVSKLKDCYVGQSEKNIRDLFDSYRSACENDGPSPILLFNEADAIFGVRKEGARNAVDKMENSIQNIILQEMERLDGILIATTNLTENLDKAFERRFLYKIKFELPSCSVKQKIWSSMISQLTEEQAIGLAKEYDFSGGQIENIARKRLIDSILFEEHANFSTIKSYCDDELITNKETKRTKVGF